ncbi:uncharacterized protein BO72DRAFT_166281 [Aspergillus fijiensis CBS 313.89]|uniref:Uncharacterized protein n=1 Tax=Aspergillus fijiensis CBS 313.89 TaxID=1448319 RepID=A0A8G1RQ67_9EURO|nr:uncharacterized protein BO72DRAFT_166281 [Aspergillus fijiensis CBS 313.89]RAK75506.1 hypothetical protein BO72DRAFT_166281 [Aspergillus fijiensis CBS 313.89]
MQRNRRDGNDGCFSTDDGPRGRPLTGPSHDPNIPAMLGRKNVDDDSCARERDRKIDSGVLFCS